MWNLEYVNPGKTTLEDIKHNRSQIRNLTVAGQPSRCALLEEQGQETQQNGDLGP